MKRKNIFLIGFLSIFLILFAGCSTQKISEIKNDDFIGKEVKVKGVVQDTIKIGELSGYVIKDDAGDSISVSSKDLPTEGKEVIAKGTLKKALLIGYYIETK